ncbi:MAG: MauE/DoxX family redox-associated membrane protein, partial [Planctomycetota bacterium]
WLIAIAISIYFYSACGKFDYQFCHTVGTDFVQAIAPTTLALQSDQAAFLALTLPAGEIVLALLLMFSRTRQAGAVLAVAMHGVLLLLLGPFGMNHSHGVLVWNGLLAIQALLLFFPKTATVKETQRSWKWTVGPVLMLALVLPCAERWGYWDHWPSWALYSPHNSRVDLEVHEVAIEQLPVSLHPFATDDDGDRWHSIDLNQWSLQQRRVPIYPQARYQLALSGAIAFGLASNDAIRAKELGVSDRFRGTRSEQFLIGVKEITQSVK